MKSLEKATADYEKAKEKMEASKARYEADLKRFKAAAESFLWLRTMVRRKGGCISRPERRSDEKS